MTHRGSSASFDVQLDIGVPKALQGPPHGHTNRWDKRIMSLLQTKQQGCR